VIAHKGVGWFSKILGVWMLAAGGSHMRRRAVITPSLAAKRIRRDGPEQACGAASRAIQGGPSQEGGLARLESSRLHSSGNGAAFCGRTVGNCGWNRGQNIAKYRIPPQHPNTRSQRAASSYELTRASFPTHDIARGHRVLSRRTVSDVICYSWGKKSPPPHRKHASG